jgi:hypothetical protein
MKKDAKKHLRLKRRDAAASMAQSHQCFLLLFFKKAALSFPYLQSLSS